jgi:hypothetical protein
MLQEANISAMAENPQVYPHACGYLQLAAGAADVDLHHPLAPLALSAPYGRQPLNAV